MSKDVKCVEHPKPETIMGTDVKGEKHPKSETHTTTGVKSVINTPNLKFKWIRM
jgi:hypothetical protein